METKGCTKWTRCQSPWLPSTNEKRPCAKVSFFFFFENNIPPRLFSSSLHPHQSSTPARLLAANSWLRGSPVTCCLCPIISVTSTLNRRQLQRDCAATIENNVFTRKGCFKCQMYGCKQGKQAESSIAGWEIRTSVVKIWFFFKLWTFSAFPVGLKPL